MKQLALLLLPIAFIFSNTCVAQDIDIDFIHIEELRALDQYDSHMRVLMEVTGIETDFYKCIKVLEATAITGKGEKL